MNRRFFGWRTRDWLVAIIASLFLGFFGAAAAAALKGNGDQPTQNPEAPLANVEAVMAMVEESSPATEDVELTNRGTI